MIRDLRVTGAFKMKRKFQKEPVSGCVKRVLLAVRTAPRKTPPNLPGRLDGHS